MPSSNSTPSLINEAAAEKFNRFAAETANRSSSSKLVAMSRNMMADEPSEAGNMEDEEEDANYEDNDYDYEEYPECDSAAQ